MEAHIIFQGKADPPRLTNLPQPIIDLSNNESITFCIIEGGMGSGDPSVMILSSDNDGTVVLQTSLDKLLTSAYAMTVYAETNWGWVRREGHFTVMPPAKPMRKAMLEAMIKELQEWDDATD